MGRGEHGEWAKYQVFEVATRVPTLIHVPGMPTAGRVTNALFELVDLCETPLLPLAIIGL